ncbi:MAG: methylenetetrahydrofolate reductase C-terminal domain-containing protein [Candidatus Aminicenantes bacterium]|nr:methylenetetrahydrofolate reductase C-terminal domain-containing protein [Candidatus Aminicenantes bacterium]
MSQETPRFDFVTYDKKPFSPAGRRFSKFILILENLVKVPLFGCQRCGECILSHTAFICSQRCPKRLRNGPCGGTGEGGTCEVYPERQCIWFRIHCRAKWLRRVPMLKNIEKLHNWNLEKTSTWLNVLSGRIEAPAIFLKKRKKS